jgi:hypothetical protein
MNIIEEFDAAQDLVYRYQDDDSYMFVDLINDLKRILNSDNTLSAVGHDLVKDMIAAANDSKNFRDDTESLAVRSMTAAMLTAATRFKIILDEELLNYYQEYVFPVGFAQKIYNKFVETEKTPEDRVRVVAGEEYDVNSIFFKEYAIYLDDERIAGFVNETTANEYRLICIEKLKKGAQ